MKKLLTDVLKNIVKINTVLNEKEENITEDEFKEMQEQSDLYRTESHNLSVSDIYLKNDNLLLDDILFKITDEIEQESNRYKPIVEVIQDVIEYYFTKYPGEATIKDLKLSKLDGISMSSEGSIVEKIRKGVEQEFEKDNFKFICAYNGLAYWFDREDKNAITKSKNKNKLELSIFTEAFKADITTDSINDLITRFYEKLQKK